ncbi:hypothetical protein ABFS83_14G257400 [Erythranthe nasuta]
MITWLHITLIAALAGILVLLFLLIFQECLHPKPRKPIVPDFTTSTSNVFRWANHPSLVADAVENGWSRFALTTTLFGVCETGWEVCEGSSDYMQKVRLNPGLKKIVTRVSNSSLSVIRAALPLPGPRLDNSSFPQEAYFELTILQGKQNEAVLLISVGLTREGQIPMQIPGSFPGSIGFNSTGSVYLNGTKIAPESKKGKWGISEKAVVIGCGYNPGRKRVFFTVDSILVHEFNCDEAGFTSPFYPTLASNADVTALVNFGQCPFKFAPGNLHRTPNPCFVRVRTLGSEDSTDLFSIGRMDSQWSAGTRSNNNKRANSIKSIEFDRESEGDLFEIVLV